MTLLPYTPDQIQKIPMANLIPSKSLVLTLQHHHQSESDTSAHSALVECTLMTLQHIQKCLRFQIKIASEVTNGFRGEAV